MNGSGKRAQLEAGGVHDLFADKRSAVVSISNFWAGERLVGWAVNDTLFDDSR
jgi:hypothetical protein